jgi:hypothetical protein
MLVLLFKLIYSHIGINCVQKIRIMRAKLAVYEQAVEWFRSADDEELQRGIEQIRSVPKDVPLP